MQLGHARRGGQVVADDVADDQRGGAVAQGKASYQSPPTCEPAAAGW
ncbi:hypothetical protein [Thermocatellispora tengchongensis]